MKKVFSFIILVLAISVCSPTLTKANSCTKEFMKYNSVEMEDFFNPVMVCFVTPFGSICIEVVVGIKTDLKNDIKVKAALSRDGQSILLSGFPPSFHGKSIKISDPDYSGFDYKGNKMFLKPGEYKVSKGKATVSLRKG